MEEIQQTIRVSDRPFIDEQSHFGDNFPNRARWDCAMGGSLGKFGRGAAAMS
jgi:hypothetical protein